MMVPPVIQGGPTPEVMGIPTELNVSMTGPRGGAPNGVHGYGPPRDGAGGATGGGGGVGGGVYPPPPYTQEDVHGPGFPQAPHFPQHAPPPPQHAPPHGGGFHPPPQFAMNTPWKLGSTDGTYAMNVAIRKQQQDGGHTLSSSSFESINMSSKNQQSAMKDARLSPLLEDGVNTTTPASQAHTPNMNNLTGGNPGGQSSASPKGGPSAPGGGVGVVIGGAAVNNPPPDTGPVGFTNPEAAALIYAVQAQQSVYQDMLFRQPCGAVEAVLAAACEAMHFDIAEMWLRTGPKTHQLTNSHLRPTALEDSVRRDLVDVYYGEKSSERTHRLSPALCKRAKEANDVVWVTGHTPHGADALRASISNVRTAVAVPVCHEASNTNITIIFFSIRRYVYIVAWFVASGFYMSFMTTHTCYVEFWSDPHRSSSWCTWPWRLVYHPSIHFPKRATSIAFRIGDLSMMIRMATIIE